MESQGVNRTAFGFGVATIASDGSFLDTFFPVLGLGGLDKAKAPDLSALLNPDSLREVSKQYVELEIDLDAPPANVSDAYLRLHLLSHRFVKPHGLKLDGIFGLLNNVVWSSFGPCAVSTFAKVRLKLQEKYGYVAVYGLSLIHI